MSEYEITPDMIWYTCLSCDRNFTLADMDGDTCPWCGSTEHKHYEEK